MDFVILMYFNPKTNYGFTVGAYAFSQLLRGFFPIIVFQGSYCGGICDPKMGATLISVLGGFWSLGPLVLSSLLLFLLDYVSFEVLFIVTMIINVFCLGGLYPVAKKMDRTKFEAYLHESNNF